MAGSLAVKEFIHLSAWHSLVEKLITVISSIDRLFSFIIYALILLGTIFCVPIHDMVLRRPDQILRLGLGFSLLYPPGRKKIRFCAIRSLIFNGSCSNFEHFSLIIGQIFEDFIQKYKFLSIYLSLKIVGFDKHAKYREKAQMLYDYDS